MKVEQSRGMMFAMAGLMLLIVGGAAPGGVISHWTFDTDFTDSSTAHDAAAGGGTPTVTAADSRFGGGALSLDGSSFLATGNWGLGGTFTAAAWVKPSNVAADWAGIFNKQFNNGQKSFWLGQQSTDGRIRFGSYYNNTNESALDAGFSLANGTWTHLAAVWDEATDTQTLYVNGYQAASIVRTGQTQPVGNDPLYIGRSTIVNFAGLIDEGWIFDQALTPDEVRNLMLRNDIAPPPARWVQRTWDFESGDLSGWNIVNTPVGDNLVFTTPGNQPAVLPHSGSYEDQTIQGTHWIRTWEGEVLGSSDGHTGIIETPAFILDPDAHFDFAIGGGNHPFPVGGDPDNLAALGNVTAITLERLVGPGDWAVLFSATGSNVNFLSPVSWDASAFVGETVRLRIYDTSTGGWGHIGVDNIVLTVTPEPATLTLLALGGLPLLRRRKS